MGALEMVWFHRMLASVFLSLIITNVTILGGSMPFESLPLIEIPASGVRNRSPSLSDSKGTSGIHSSWRLPPQRFE